MQKRPNPFAKKINETVVETPKVEEVEETVEEEQIVEPVRRVVTPKRQQIVYEDDVNREKYTATMDIQLRRQIKIYCATEGIMFSKFIEDACREKIRRNGGR